MAALAVCVIAAAQARPRTGTQAPPPASPDDLPPADPGLIPLTVAEIKRLFNAATARPRSFGTPPAGHAGDAATKPAPAGSTNAPGSPANPNSPRSNPKMRLPY